MTGRRAAVGRALAGALLGLVVCAGAGCGRYGPPKRTPPAPAASKEGTERASSVPATSETGGAATPDGSASDEREEAQR
jgi:hypothetical protein